MATAEKKRAVTTQTIPHWINGKGDAGYGTAAGRGHGFRDR